MGKKYDLNGKVALITGATGGIGAASARALYQQGASLVLTDLSRQALDSLAAEFDAQRVLALPLDVTDAAASKAVVERIVERFGRLDIAFANAGIAWRNTPATIASCDEAEFEKIIDVDLFGVWRTIRAALPEVQRNHGQIVITSSIYSFVNGMVNAPYAASKAAVEMLGRALRAELAGTGASASVLYPGWTATPIADLAFGGHATASELIESAFPAVLRKQVQPEEIATALVAGLATRSAAIIAPARWKPLSMLRGVMSPLSDALLERSTKIQRLVRNIESNQA
ncbi:SDR family NAD(P)-dependent oxidoreductase [Alcanivorax sp.]|uniref:SDR family NAD(P)-dependent oxidoreductase n=1 Tax=Alcanivorax sp. TaxID=1872427 RepID=UPI0019A2AC76|nr:SDR family NAD(P)-dependent oxidoreductase [Alcanivorax sp.]MBD3644895.1 SDR family NAD(P)-dependent oxidoreductase [Alcanivorax sp.]